eukprot:TRINITY_DN11490_c0_g1_i1.p1 TRINITY_DN11490_c0_g1~~TRINITY_DN11490_c0_g1_i1.p1  ORF type:complete len:462 (-),score=89.41 TRINITY_DN11490_c0_g1_i1:229-1614(-)
MLAKFPPGHRFRIPGGLLQIFFVDVARGLHWPAFDDGLASAGQGIATTSDGSISTGPGREESQAWFAVGRTRSSVHPTLTAAQVEVLGDEKDNDEEWNRRGPPPHIESSKQRPTSAARETTLLLEPQNDAPRRMMPEASNAPQHSLDNQKDTLPQATYPSWPSLSGPAAGVVQGENEVLAQQEAFQLRFGGSSLPSDDSQGDFSHEATLASVSSNQAEDETQIQVADRSPLGFTAGVDDEEARSRRARNREENEVRRRLQQVKAFSDMHQSTFSQVAGATADQEAEVNEQEEVAKLSREAARDTRDAVRAAREESQHLEEETVNAIRNSYEDRLQQALILVREQSAEHVRNVSAHIRADIDRAEYKAVKAAREEAWARESKVVSTVRREAAEREQRAVTKLRNKIENARSGISDNGNRPSASLATRGVSFSRVATNEPVHRSPQASSISHMYLLRPRRAVP